MIGLAISLNPCGTPAGMRSVSDQPARALILCAPSCGLDQMFVEIEAAAADGMPAFEKLAAITAKYGVTLMSPPSRETAVAAA